MKPIISVGVLNHNGENYIKKVLESIKSQNTLTKEIVVLHNGCTDMSPELVKQFDNIKVIESKRNLAYGKAKNLLVQACRGEYILLLDNDVVLNSRNTLKLLLKQYKHLGDNNFLSIPLIDTNKTKTIHYGLFYNDRKSEIDLKSLQEKKCMQVGGFVGGFVFFKKSLFIEIGGYDNQYPFNNDDYDLSARASIMGFDCYVLTTVVAEHLGTTASLKRLRWKTQYEFCGFSRMVFKNYSSLNICKWWPPSCTYLAYKTSVNAIKHDPHILLSFLKSIGLFIQDLSDTIKAREKIQAKRKRRDQFLCIKNPFGKN